MSPQASAVQVAVAVQAWHHGRERQHEEGSTPGPGGGHAITIIRRPNHVNMRPQWRWRSARVVTDKRAQSAIEVIDTVTQLVLEPLGQAGPVLGPGDLALGQLR